MKRKILFLSALLLLTCGCATSICRHTMVEPGQKDSRGRDVVAEIQGKNYGYYLFYAIPLWSGAPHRPNEQAWDLWLHRVRKRDMVRMFQGRARKLGAKEISDVKVAEQSSGFWSLWIIWHRSVSGSCVAVSKK